MAVEAIIFDSGATLTPWHSVDHKALWHAVCEGHFPAGQAAEAALAIPRPGRNCGSCPNASTGTRP